jgi:hypothetical protein
VDLRELLGGALSPPFVEIDTPVDWRIILPLAPGANRIFLDLVSDTNTHAAHTPAHARASR